MPDKDINIHLKTQGTAQTKQEVDSVGNSTEKMGKKIDAAGGQSQANVSRFEALRNTLATLKSQILGILGTIGALIAILIKWEQHAQKTAAAQKGLVDSTKGLDQATKAYASQANVMGDPAMVDKGRQQIIDLQQAAKLGTMDQAGNIISATHSAFGTSGELLDKDTMGIATALGNFARMKNVDDAGIGDATKLLAAMGVKNKEEAELRLQQLSTVQLQSKAQTFSEFIGGAIKSMVPALAQKSSPEFAMGAYGSALDVAASKDLAAEMTKQADALIQMPNVVSAIEDYFGMKEGDFREMDKDARSWTMALWSSVHVGTGAGQKYLLDSGVSPERLSVITSLFNPQQTKRIKYFEGLAKGATGRQFLDDLAGWDAGIQGQIEAINAQAEAAGATATEDERIGQSLFELGDEQWKQIEANGGNDLSNPDFIEKPTRTVWGPLRARLRRIGKAYREGKLPESSHQELNSVEDFITDIMPTIGDPLTAAETGEANRRLRQLEKQANITINNHPIIYGSGIDHNTSPEELSR